MFGLGYAPEELDKPAGLSERQRGFGNMRCLRLDSPRAGQRHLRRLYDEPKVMFPIINVQGSIISWQENHDEKSNKGSI